MRPLVAAAVVAAMLTPGSVAFAQVAVAPQLVLPNAEYDRVRATARDRADAACAGAEALDKGDLDLLAEDAGAAAQLATARLEATKMESALAMFRFLGSAAKAAQAVGETRFAGAPIDGLLAGYAVSVRRLEAAGGAASFEMLIARLRRPGDIVAEDLDEARATVRQLDIMLANSYTVVARLYRENGGDSGAIEEFLGAKYPLDPLAGGRWFDAVEAKIDRQSLVDTIARLATEVEERTEIMAYESRLRDCLEELREDAPDAPPPPDALSACRRHEGPVRAEFFVEVMLDVPGLGCRSAPCFDGSVVIAPGRIYENGCLYACLSNYGDVGGIGSEFELYGMVGADDGVDARLLISNVGNQCRGGREHRSQFWRMQSPLEILFLGKLFEPRDGTMAGGGGALGPPADMPADWAAKFSGAHGTWHVVPRPNWADQ